MSDAKKARDAALRASEAHKGAADEVRALYILDLNLYIYIYICIFYLHVFTYICVYIYV